MYLMFRKYSVEEEEMLRIIFNDVDKAHYKVDPSNILYKVITKKKTKASILHALRDSGSVYQVMRLPSRVHEP